MPIQSGTMVQLTDIAAEKVRDFMNGQGAEGDIGLRVGVRGGGCSGFQYALALDERRDDDHVFEVNAIRVLVDPASLRYVDGSTVDFTESFQGSGFEVSNPNVVASCGCGSSFRVADEEPSCGSAA
jgi:iron-sulfur cluster assembly accessory protein